jgi:hypothetical protein
MRTRLPANETIFGYDIGIMGRFSVGPFVAAWLLLCAASSAQTDGEGCPEPLGKNPFYIDDFKLPADFVFSPKTISRRPGVDGEAVLGEWGHGDGPALTHLLGKAETVELAQGGGKHRNALLVRLNAEGSYLLLLYYPTSEADSSGSNVFIERGTFGWMGPVVVLSPESYHEIVGSDGRTATAEVTRGQMPRTYALYAALFRDLSAVESDQAPANPGIVLEGPVCPPFARIGDGYCSDLGEGRFRFRAELQRIIETRP